MKAQKPHEPRFGVDLTPSYLMGLRANLPKNPSAFATGSESLGGRIVQRAGRGQEVFDLRPFVDGDDPRHLDHRATARKGRLHIKRFHEERNTKLMLVLDLRPAMYFGLRRAFMAFAAAELLVLNGWSHLADQGHVGLFAFTNTQEVFLRPSPRDQAMARAIGEICALYEAGMKEAATGAPSVALSDRLSGLVRLAERGSMLLLSSSFDHAGAQIEAMMDQLRHRQKLTTFVMSCSDLAELPAGHYPVVNELAERSDLTGFSKPSLPAYLNAGRGDMIVDASRSPSAIHAGDMS